MIEKKPMLEYARPPKRRVWPWIVGAILLGLLLLYGVALWYVNTYGGP